MEIKVNELEFKKTCLRNEKAALEALRECRTLMIATYGGEEDFDAFLKKQEEKVAWMEQEIAKMEKK